MAACRPDFFHARTRTNIMARVDYGEFGYTESEAVMDTIGVDPG